MRLSAPRVPPVDLETFRRLSNELLGVSVRDDEEVLNVRRTYARNPALMRAQHPYQQHLVTHTTLPERDHQFVVLRIGWLCRSEYEVSQHATRGGLTAEDVARIGRGPDAPGLTEWEATLLRAVDELHRDHFISDATWAALSKRYSVEQLMDAVALIGRYWTVSVFLNTFGVQLEEGKPRFPL